MGRIRIIVFSPSPLLVTLNCHMVTQTKVCSGSSLSFVIVFFFKIMIMMPAAIINIYIFAKSTLVTPNRVLDIFLIIWFFITTMLHWAALPILFQMCGQWRLKAQPPGFQLQRPTKFWASSFLIPIVISTIINIVNDNHENYHKATLETLSINVYAPQKEDLSDQNLSNIQKVSQVHNIQGH